MRGYLRKYSVEIRSGSTEFMLEISYYQTCAGYEFFTGAKLRCAMED